MIRGVISHVLATLGIRWSAEQGWLPVLGLLFGGLLVFAAIAWVIGKLTAREAYEDGGVTMVRGGCLAIPIIGCGLIFVAAVLWAWRYLFGSGYY